jgi:V/A-type H+-transporting ATPase subunit K
MFGFTISAGTVITMIIAGYVMQKRHYAGGRRIYIGCLALSSFLVGFGAVISLTSGQAFAASAAVATGGPGMGFIAAAIVTSIACCAAGYAVANVGSAAIGLIGEKPEMLGATLIYLGLAEGIAIYGLIVSLLILQKL